MSNRGVYDASINLFPSINGSGSGGAILAGDFWVISVAGVLGGTPVIKNDIIFAIVNSPGQTASNWNVRTSTTQDLNPQFFPDGAVTILPNLDFYALAQARLPQIYNSAQDFMGLIFSIATIKQAIYDVIQSLCNVYNLYSSRSINTNIATPQGVYLRMLATDLGASFSDGDSDSTVFSSIIRRINLVVSRGQPIAFFNYFEQNNLSGFFTNNAVQEVNNATIFFNVPVPNEPLITPNPLTVFSQDMFRLKAAGIKVIVNSTTNIPYFQLADLNGHVAPENAGFAGLNIFGQPYAGGYYHPYP